MRDCRGSSEVMNHGLWVGEGGREGKSERMLSAYKVYH